jgi:plastocyanin
MKHMKKGQILSILLAILLAGGLFMACKKSYSSGNSNNMSSVSISIKSSAYSNANLQVNTGANVTWKNDDTTAHTVTANDGSFDSGNIQPGSSYSHQFNSVGTFMYHDKLHESMSGTIVVIAPSSSGGY